MSELFEGDAVKHAPADLQVQPKKEIATVQSQDDRLLEKVLESGNIEVLERYIALRKSEEERQAKLAFEEHFSKLRSELRPVVKQKENTFLKTKYAPLDVLQEACDPIILKHGFFYTWREEAINGGKRVWMDISGYGHTKSNYFDTPDLETIKNREGKDVTNVLQARGIQSTYGQRYTFKAGFGIVLAGEDTDGSFTLTEVETAEPYKALITAAQTKQDLVNVFGRIWKETADNKHVQKLVQAAYEARKREIA